MYHIFQIIFKYISSNLIFKSLNLIVNFIVNIVAILIILLKYFNFNF